MSKGYSKGSASNCKCKEGVANPTAYGDISCLGSLGDDYGNIMKLFLSGRQCREMASVYSYEISAKCRTKGYKTGKRLSSIQCSERKDTGWSITSVRCEGQRDFF
ncbi:hypothetical protein PsalN5692_03846 (plasmid) [Piscirickettsia salmonis]|nr:hypothetical protein PsalN5692_03846 [Piscirickettsia salmonis]